MSFSQEKSCDDEDWLLAHYPNANEEKIESFLERVAIMIVDGNVPEETARVLSAKELGL